MKDTVVTETSTANHASCMPRSNLGGSGGLVRFTLRPQSIVMPIGGEGLVLLEAPA